MRENTIVVIGCIRYFLGDKNKKIAGECPVELRGKGNSSRHYATKKIAGECPVESE